MKQLKLLIDKLGRDRLVILLIGGLLILVISIPVNPEGRKKEGSAGKKTDSSATADSYKAENFADIEMTDTDYAAYLERKLEKSLQYIDGAGQVRVMVTLSDTGGCLIEKDIAYERENESQRNPDGTTATSTRSTDSEETVYTVDEKGNSIPLVSKRILPSVEGILIVAQGGGDAKVKSEIKRAVLSLFKLDEHKISIVKMKAKNG